MPLNYRPLYDSIANEDTMSIVYIDSSFIGVALVSFKIVYKVL